MQRIKNELLFSAKKNTNIKLFDLNMQRNKKLPGKKAQD